MSGPIIDAATQLELQKQLELPVEDIKYHNGYEDPSVRAMKRERKERAHQYRQKKQKEENRRKEKNRRKANRRNR